MFNMKEPKDGDIRLKNRHTHIFKTFGDNKDEYKYTLQKYNSANGWADLYTEEEYIYVH